MSLDGGGIRGVFQAAFLSNLEAHYLRGRSIGSYFDLLTGTSTGGIIALGLANSMPAAAVLDLYVRHGKEIFPPVRGPLRRLKRVARYVSSFTRYRYEREPLEHYLRKAFKGTIVGELERRVCVPAFDGQTETYIFKTPHHPDFRADWREELVTVGLATSAAPSFFSVYQHGERKFADGGVWANNPIMIGLVDALSCYTVRPDQIEILSLGCGEEQMRITPKQIRKGGLFHWRKIISAAMHLSSQNALGQAGLLIGRNRIQRVDAALENPIELDDASVAIEKLPSIAAELAQVIGPEVADRFLATPAAPFDAFHGPRLTSGATPHVK